MGSLASRGTSSSSTGSLSLIAGGTVLEDEPMTEIVTNIRAVKGSFQWVIEDWSSMPPAVNSADVECAGHRWRLRIYPGGREEEFAGHVSLYLYYCGREQGVSTSYTLRIVNQLVGKPDFVVSVSRKKNFGFIHTGDVVNNRGFPTFISQARLNDESRGLKVNNKVVVRAELTVTAEEPTHTVRETSSGGRWSPSESLARDFLAGLQSGEDTSVTLIAEDRQLPAHKEILALRSPVFRAMFAHWTQETARREISIPDLPASAVSELLRFIYTDSCSEGALETLGDQLLAAADKYQVERLRQLCEVELANSLSIENAAERLALAEMHAAEQLKEECVEFVARHAEEVMKTPGWSRLVSSGTNVGVVNEVLATAVGSGRKRSREVLEDEVPESTSALTVTGVKRLRVSELRRELCSRGLDAGGPRHVLQERLASSLTPADTAT